ncbi:hypothetical protein [Nocardioides sp. SYSU DS0651]|uniref:hypothetical protein n=1 Tax=Nocardioides sp. SYSU DS0651 TaxID=3415955 RepID=UPI003F4B713C
MDGYVVMWDGVDRVELPAAGRDAGRGLEISIWDRDEALAEFAATMSGGTPLPSGGLRVPVALLPRPDNNYDPLAVSVAVPQDPAEPRTRDDRHLGYLFIDDLEKFGRELLHDLARYGGGEVRATAILRPRSAPRLDVPAPRDVGRSVTAFLAAPATPPLSSRPTLSNLLGIEAERQEKTRYAIECITTYPAPAAQPARIDLVTRVDKSLALLDATSGREVGVIYFLDADTAGMLTLADERQRTAVLEQLARLQVPILPRSPVPEQIRRSYPDIDGLPPANLYLYHRHGGLDFRYRDHRDARNRDTAVGYYHSETGQIWVEDADLVPHVVSYAARLGLQIGPVEAPKVPWNLQWEVFVNDRRGDPKPPSPKAFEYPWQVKLHPAPLRKIPDGILAALTPRHPESKARDETRRPAEDRFWLWERFVSERSLLFPDHKALRIRRGCRLCSNPALEFTTPICTEPLAYCHACLRTATIGGQVSGRQGVVRAVRELAALEFDNSPMLAEQLETIHVDPTDPRAAVDIDRLVLLRFGVGGGFAWTRVLEEAGLAKDGLRVGRGTLIRARDGHLCMSLREKAVDDFLHQHGIKHDREPLYPQHLELNASGKRRADWKLSDGTFVELWGLPNQAAYAEKMRQKQQLAKATGLRLVGLVDADLPRMPEIFADWLPPGILGRTTWQWSPVTIIADPVKRTRAASARQGPGDGRNDYNAEQRAQRLDRCARAVALQRSGLSRAEVAKELGVGQETAEQLLRDGKFYAEPAMDPARQKAAGAARVAQAAGQTRAEFQQSGGLSRAKAFEAWKDAAVLFVCEVEDGPAPDRG